jgi:hypothetical protein
MFIIGVAFVKPRERSIALHSLRPELTYCTRNN